MRKVKFKKLHVVLSRSTGHLGSVVPTISTLQLSTVEEALEVDVAHVSRLVGDVDCRADWVLHWLLYGSGKSEIASSRAVVH
jgi:hypothetical protein